MLRFFPLFFCNLFFCLFFLIPIFFGCDLNRWFSYSYLLFCFLLFFFCLPNVQKYCQLYIVFSSKKYPFFIRLCDKKTQGLRVKASRGFVLGELFRKAIFIAVSYGSTFFVVLFRLAFFFSFLFYRHCGFIFLVFLHALLSGHLKKDATVGYLGQRSEVFPLCVTKYFCDGNDYFEK